MNGTKYKVHLDGYNNLEHWTDASKKKTARREFFFYDETDLMAVRVGPWKMHIGVKSDGSWWNDKHNAHHANPNHDGLDPDIDIPFMAFSEEQALRKRGLSRLITAYQAFLFFPALTLTTYSMQIASVLFTVRER